MALKDEPMPKSTFFGAGTSLLKSYKNIIFPPYSSRHMVYLLALYLAYLLAFYLAYLLALYLTFYLGYLLAFYLAVEVQRCTLSWAGPRLRSSGAH